MGCVRRNLLKATKIRMIAEGSIGAVNNLIAEELSYYFTLGIVDAPCHLTVLIFEHRLNMCRLVAWVLVANEVKAVFFGDTGQSMTECVYEIGVRS